MLKQKSIDLYNQWWDFKEDLDDAMYVIWKLIQNKPDNWDTVMHNYNSFALDMFSDTLERFNCIALRQIELQEYISDGDTDRTFYPTPQPVFVGFDPKINKTRIFEFSEIDGDVPF